MTESIGRKHAEARERLKALGTHRISGKRLDYRGTLTLHDGRTVTATGKSQLATMQELARAAAAADAA